MFPPRWAWGRAALLAAGLLTGWLASAHAADTSCPDATAQVLRLPATIAAIASGKPITIVALGSSSTVGAGASAPAMAYPARLEALLRAAWPGRQVNVINKGVGGETTVAMASRLNRDVLAFHPALVIWQAGANDVLQQQDPDRFRTTLEQGVGKLYTDGIDVVLMDNQVAPALEKVPNAAEYGAIISATAARFRISLFSRTALMHEWAETGKDVRMIGADGLHHTDRGYACLAAALANSIVRSTSHP